MQVEDIKTVWELAVAELDNEREGIVGKLHEEHQKACDEVEMWLREVGALPPR